MAPWLNYRGTKLYAEGVQELPGWREAYPHACPVIVSGVLEEAMLPDLGQLTLKSPQDLKKYYIIRKPSWKPRDEPINRPIKR